MQPSSRSLRLRWWREPLVHFGTAGALIFLAQAATGSDARDIPLTQAIQQEVRQELAARLGRLPTPQEQAQALARWKLEEALYREGLARGLDRDDPLVRSRVVQKLRTIQAGLLLPEPPTERDLRAWLTEHSTLYTTPVRYDFEQVFFAKQTVNAQARARAIAATLEDGSPAPGVGDEPPEGRAVLGRTLQDLTQSFGASFARSLASLSPGRWELLESDRGYHLVRLERVEGGVPSFDELRPRLHNDVLLARREALRRQAEQQTLARYRFVESAR